MVRWLNKKSFTVKLDLICPLFGLSCDIMIKIHVVHLQGTAIHESQLDAFMQDYTSGFHLPLQRIINIRLLSMPDVASTSANAPVCYNDESFTFLGNRALPDDNRWGNYMRLCCIFLPQPSFSLLPWMNCASCTSIWFLYRLLLFLWCSCALPLFNSLHTPLAV